MDWQFDKTLCQKPTQQKERLKYESHNNSSFTNNCK